MPTGSLKNKTLKGVAWNATDHLLRQGITFIIGLILARLLSPAEYGILGLAMVVIAILQGFVDSGFSNALIRKQEVSEVDYSTMFVANMVMSAVLYCILFFTAPLVAQFMEADITLLIRILGVSLIISAFSIVQSTNLTKNINFKIPTIASFISVIIGGVTGVICAFLGYGVWALVAQQLITSVTNVIILWLLNPWRPSIRFSWDSLRYMWSFGWKLLLSGVLDQIWKQIYTIVVGKVYSPSTLGQYSRARHYAAFFANNIHGVVRNVTYPVLSTLQDNTERMVGAYRRIIKVSMLVTVICMFGLGAVAEPLIYCLIGEKWIEAASYLPFMCVSMSMYPLHSINLNMLKIQGRSDIFLYLEIIKKVIAVLPISLGIFIGIKWMLIGSIFTGIIAFFLNSYYTGKKLDYNSWQQLKDIAPSYAIATIVALSVYFLKYLPITYFVILPIQLIVGAVVCIAICETLKRPEYIEVKSIAMDAIRKLRKK